MRIQNMKIQLQNVCLVKKCISEHLETGFLLFKAQTPNNSKN